MSADRLIELAQLMNQSRLTAEAVEAAIATVAAYFRCSHQQAMVKDRPSAITRLSSLSQ